MLDASTSDIDNRDNTAFKRHHIGQIMTTRKAFQANRVTYNMIIHDLLSTIATDHGRFERSRTHQVKRTHWLSRLK
ncbi:hypothetical protein THIX_60662 [Thiomonas sp. X19]|nr:hypothetical protein THIX_60662 [Thiomonas sp. X19]